ncbi:hypothetical protein RF11_09492 [Thelohanellus kitauei]|uniref:DUF4371 domain-containing protein n=1 Tax=Thelohanellus kitauei TaxID=669202 RepID=A0A0C2N1T0_THEKT|nr:hypothetical protein RF11_09492 [Thelohanellus kitauei]
MYIFLMILDESNDISDTTQAASLYSSTHLSDLFETLESYGEKNNTEWEKLVCVCTDGTPVVREQFLDGLIQKYHCVINQKAPCGKTLNIKHVIDVVIGCVKKI